MTDNWRPLWEAQTETDFSRRVIMAGYDRCSTTVTPENPSGRFAKVGEAVWMNPDERGSRWMWKEGGDVINPLGFQDFPDFPIASENSVYVTGKPY